MLNISSERLGELAQIGNGLGLQVCSEQTVSSAAGVLGTKQPWGRFGGGSARNRALLGEASNPVHFMQVAQSRINTGDSAYR